MPGNEHNFRGRHRTPPDGVPSFGDQFLGSMMRSALDGPLAAEYVRCGACGESTFVVHPFVEVVTCACGQRNATNAPAPTEAID